MGTLKYLSSDERMAVEHLKSVLYEWFGTDFVKAMLFGERVKDSNPAGKDMDVLIIVKDIDQAKLDRITLIIMDINMEFDVILTQMVYDESEFNDPVHRESPIIQKILKESVTL